MKWKFWDKKQQNSMQNQLDSIQHQLSGISENAAESHQYLNFIAEKMNANSEQITKLSRFQYKSVQESQSRLEHLEQGLDTIKNRQGEQASQMIRIAELEQNVDTMIHTLIRWLDDIDHLCNSLPEGDEWNEVLRQWGNQLSAALQVLDIYEFNVLDHSFDPHTSESIGTVSESSSEIQVPYQVVQVIKRGYRQKDAKLLRKAQVITLHKEEPKDV
jgi:molecular chaperone GrpE (heat shock protein)